VLGLEHGSPEHMTLELHDAQGRELKPALARPT
jgi:hypothetical protein